MKSGSRLKGTVEDGQGLGTNGAVREEELLARVR
jgi:hypothetical protein